MKWPVEIVAISDNHGLEEPIARIRQVYSKEADYFFHLGDSEFPKRMLQGYACVRGNNDYYSACHLPWEQLIELDGVRIYMTHGHRMASEMGLVYKAQELNARVAMFGHTHVPFCEEQQGVMLLNPGSAGNYCRGGRARASILEINRGQLRVSGITV